MAAPEFIPDLPPPARRRLEVIEGGVPSLSRPQLSILNRQELGKPHQLPSGARQRYLYKFSDGSTHNEPTYEVRLYEPASEHRLERGLISTVPWLTGLDGHHESLNEEAIASDIVSVAVSREVNGLCRASRQLGHISLAQEAHIQLLVHQDLAERGHFMKEEVTGTGYSLAAIVLNGVAAYAAQHHTKLVHGEALDPGPARKLKRQEIQPRSLALGAAKEFGELLNVIRHSPPKEAKRLLRTFPLGPRVTLQNMGFGIALTMTGESAKLAAKVPQDTSLNITTFKGFPFNQVEEYRGIFANHKNVRFTEEKGHHFSGAKEKWRMLIVGRTALVQRELEAGVPAAKINHKKIDKTVRKKIEHDKSLAGL
jgi:hypothetical protein